MARSSIKRASPSGILCKADIMLPDLVTKFEAAVEGSSPKCRHRRPMKVQRVGICTGAAGAHIEDAYKAGIDTFITGEGPRRNFLRAEEARNERDLGGHYWTETAGVRALAEHLSEKFKLGLEYMDHPSGI